MVGSGQAHGVRRAGRRVDEVRVPRQRGGALGEFHHAGAVEGQRPGADAQDGAGELGRERAVADQVRHGEHEVVAVPAERADRAHGLVGLPAAAAAQP